MVPGISDQWLAGIMFIAAGLGIIGFLLIDSWRLDPRARRNREKAAAEPRPGK
jgi:uncharacterized SAM-binding protein YcdF (DUF218 family)